MKKLKLLIALLTVSLSMGVIAACGGGGDDSSLETQSSTATQQNPPVSVGGGDSSSALKEIEGVSFTGATYVYDGQQKQILIVGDLPSGVTPTYTNNVGTDVGTYNASVVLSGEGYQTKTLTATLTITKAEITANLQFDNDTVEYDTFAHSLTLIGDVPSGVVVTYTYNGQEVDGVTEVGQYTVQAILTGANYQTKTLTATLTIQSTEKLLYSINHNGTVYFQNDLDDQKLYKVEDGEVIKVCNDVPERFYSNGTDLYYYSSSLFSKKIKKISGTSKPSDVYSVSGESLTCDGDYVYYAVNNLVFNTDENGIYRYKLDGSESEPTRLTTDKADYLVVEDGYLYYCNLSQGKHLYALNLQSLQSTCIVEEQVSYIIEDKGVLYFDSKPNGLLTNSTICRYIIAEQKVVKMTNDSGMYLTKVGNDIYYVNNDILTSKLFGDGIYKVSATANALMGTKVISATDNGYSSLTSDGTLLYYYKLNDKHLYSYNPQTEEETDLMASFVPPVEEVALMGEAKLAEYNGEIYYTNPRDNSCLYKYNTQTRQHSKVLADCVAGVWFNGDYMYYSTFILTNYALFRMDMKTGEIVKLCSDRCESLIFENDSIYFIDTNASPVKNVLKKMNLDGTNVQDVFTSENMHITGMQKIGNTFYFVRNPLGYKTLCSYTLGESKMVNTGEKMFEMVIVGNKVYYYYEASTVANSALKRCNLDGSNAETLVSGVQINDIFVEGNNVYYSSTKGSIGTFCYNLSTSQNANISDDVADGITLINNQVWFIQTAVEYTELLGVSDMPIHAGEGDGYLYVYDGNIVTKK